MSDNLIENINNEYNKLERYVRVISFSFLVFFLGVMAFLYYSMITKVSLIISFYVAAILCFFSSYYIYTKYKVFEPFVKFAISVLAIVTLALYFNENLEKLTNRREHGISDSAFLIECFVIIVGQAFLAFRCGVELKNIIQTLSPKGVPKTATEIK